MWASFSRDAPDVTDRGAVAVRRFYAEPYVVMPTRTLVIIRLEARKNQLLLHFSINHLILHLFFNSARIAQVE